jgi:hypothetical protein
MSLEKLAKIAIVETIVGLIGLGVYCIGIANCKDQPLNEMIKNPCIFLGAAAFYGAIVSLVAMSAVYDYRNRNARESNRNI